MGQAYYEHQTRVRFGPPLTPAVKALVIANAAVFAVQILFYVATPKGSMPRGLTAFEEWFALTPALAIGGLRAWQFVTHSFLHDVAGPLHIIFNMFLLWMFGSNVEMALGRRRFFWLYFGAVLAGGVCMIPWYHTAMLGASGAVFGVMAMYARLFPGARVFVWGIFPIRARTLAFVLVGLELFYLAAAGPASNIAHLAHLGGFGFGWFFLRIERAVDESRRARELRNAARTTERDREVRAKVDELLAKVGREGLDSLSRSEREFLAHASRRFRR